MRTKEEIRERLEMWEDKEVKPKAAETFIKHELRWVLDNEE